VGHDEISCADRDGDVSVPDLPDKMQWKIQKAALQIFL